jgi:hypothetical protein
MIGTYAGRAVALTLVAALAGLLSGGAGASADATAFQLMFDGMHRPATFPSPNGLQHEGPFTASKPFCASGYAKDFQHQLRPLSAFRRYTCDDGSGTVTAHIDLFPDEHAVGLSDTWKIVEGTGDYAKLRGQGTWKSVSVGGDPGNPASITFRSVLTGVVDFDDAAPSVSLGRVTAKKLAGSRRGYVVRIPFSAQDDNAVSYRLELRDRLHVLVSKIGTVAAGMAPPSLRIVPPRGVRRVTLALTASDAVGNERTVARSVKLP